MVSPALPLPQVGQSVLVDWGLDDVKGEVLEVYGSGPLMRVRVKIPILGTHGEELDAVVVSLPLDVVHSA